MFSRRKFLQTSLMAGAAATFIKPAYSFATDYLSFDLHCHPGSFYGRGVKDYQGDAGVIKTVTEMNTGRLSGTEMNTGRLSGAFFSLVADMPLLERTPTGIKFAKPYAAGEAWKEYQRQMAALKELLKTLPVTTSTKASDLDNAFKNKKAAAYIACEGGDFLDGNASLLDQMYADGVRSLQIVHYAQNALGDLQTEPAQHNGLSFSGREVVKKMNKLGMVIDVAHASMMTVQDVAYITEAPIILSHSILKIDDTRPLSKRAITPEHAKLVASTGGVRRRLAVRFQ